MDHEGINTEDDTYLVVIGRLVNAVAVAAVGVLEERPAATCRSIRVRVRAARAFGARCSKQVFVVTCHLLATTALRPSPTALLLLESLPLLVKHLERVVLLLVAEEPLRVESALVLAYKCRANETKKRDKKVDVSE
jgi:hypothetical protein